jgi:predicted RNase H-like nuclease (RuvC/YqgF family)
MKRISLLLVTLALCGGPGLRAQDAATEERLNKLAGQVEDLRAGQEAMRKQVEALAKEIESLRDQMTRPSGNYAAQEDLKRVVKGVEEVDRKRLEDYDKIRNELVNLRKSLLNTPSQPGKTHSTPVISSNSSSEKTASSDKGYEYVVKKGDSLSVIIQAYRDNNIKVTQEQILKANPGLVPEKMRVGQKIFIPAPQS